MHSSKRKRTLASPPPSTSEACTRATASSRAVEVDATGADATLRFAAPKNELVGAATSDFGATAAAATGFLAVAPKNDDDAERTTVGAASAAGASQSPEMGLTAGSSAASPRSPWTASRTSSTTPVSRPAPMVTLASASLTTWTISALRLRTISPTLPLAPPTVRTTSSSVVGGDSTRRSSASLASTNRGLSSSLRATPSRHACSALSTSRCSSPGPQPLLIGNVGTATATSCSLACRHLTSSDRQPPSENPVRWLYGSISNTPAEVPIERVKTVERCVGSAGASTSIGAVGGSTGVMRSSSESTSSPETGVGGGGGT